MTGLVLIAASGLAREVLASVRRSGEHTVIGFLDDDPSLAGAVIDGVPVLGAVSAAARHRGAEFVLCAGKGADRAAIAGRLALLGIGPDRCATIVDARAVVSPGCFVGSGSVLLANVVLTAGVRMGNHVVAMPGVTFTHDDVVADFATFTAGVSLGGGVRIGRGAYLGMNSTVREHCAVGVGAVVGMGAAVVTDVPDGETWAGVPARPLYPSAVRRIDGTMGRRA
ncbi:NeuD/PglB/VioB family sugar acetyltransferase [Specibacter cremeus]|uniref:NeuD/PglB/VioB family sugar acetyltransferase n=1 Tax=Specibacter cremeus TaxID=1629051 RepID=UPI000F79E3FF|nr:NeuD/PglB/VioB family sugar acetyltransferase [Specibacter cremeus]